jgi:anti-sigma factor RsiW
MNREANRDGNRGGPRQVPGCEEASLALAGKIAGELAPDAARALELHVARCARCARELAELEALHRLFERDAVAPSGEVAEARLRLRRALERERAAPRVAAAIAAPKWTARLLRRELLQAAGFALLLALFVPVLPRLQRSIEAKDGGSVALSLADGARDLASHVGAWLPSLPAWSLPTEPPASLRSWLGALHSEAR